jgi:hypothetical protein
LPPEYQAGFREQLAGGRTCFRAIAVHVSASEFVAQKLSGAAKNITNIGGFGRYR